MAQVRGNLLEMGEDHFLEEDPGNFLLELRDSSIAADKDHFLVEGQCDSAQIVR